MRRGEVWIVAGGGGYAGKPRPIVIVQDDQFSETDSVVACPFTTEPTDAPLFRLPVSPNHANGLLAPCQLMVDKITAVRRDKLGRRVGRLEDETMLKLNRAVAMFLGFGARPNDT